MENQTIFSNLHADVKIYKISTSFPGFNFFYNLGGCQFTPSQSRVAS